MLYIMKPDFQKPLAGSAKWCQPSIGLKRASLCCCFYSSYHSTFPFSSCSGGMSAVIPGSNFSQMIPQTGFLAP
jgi:hypothetical protein